MPGDTSPVVEALQGLGQVAGIAGIAVGAALLVFRDIIRKTVLRNLSPDHSYRLMRMTIGAVWSIAVIGMIVGYAPKIFAVQFNTVNSQQNVGSQTK
jgi:hypothetical protein